MLKSFLRVIFMDNLKEKKLAAKFIYRNYFRIGLKSRLCHRRADHGQSFRRISSFSMVVETPNRISRIAFCVVNVRMDVID